MPVLRVESIEDFTKRTEDRDFEICKHIYAAVQKAIAKNTKTVKVFDLVLDTDPYSKYAFSLERGQWRQALESCLEAYTKVELYEDCTTIKSLIESL